MKDILIDKARGCLVGGAAGDALGYAVEFSSLEDIVREYGPSGITGYKLDSKGVARFSDDTQMTLFTAEGLLSAYAADPDPSPESILRHIEEAYLAWLATQTGFQLPLPTSWLTHVKDLWARRAPGNTCITALSDLKSGLTPHNDSKGCGAVMRIAPIGIYYAAHTGQHNTEDLRRLTARIAADCARITHLNDLSTLASVFTALVVFECMRIHVIDRLTLRSIIASSLDGTLTAVPDSGKAGEFVAIIQKALDLAGSSVPDREAISRLGEGWVAEETVGVAVFCVMRYIRDFEGCLVAAVNHDGDSDSTGAVAGNIIGAILGYTGIPEKFRKGLELHDVLLSVADDLAGASDATQIHERYVAHRPYGIDAGLKFISGMKFTPEHITELAPDDIFVFGSNLAGHHAGGAARVARQRFGAIEGQGVGLQGQSYAIPTMQGGVETIKPYVDDFIEVARECDQNTFYVTRIGCGIAGFRDEEIAPLFRDALKLYNVRLPESFVRILLDDKS
ncbi:MAG: ADP-ribosylglycohydrolase family protein [Muribaculaceae bacterium]|nr:ADP-ribosylglycohydrolase family protein [Muribaculaceae bacterium]